MSKTIYIGGRLESKEKGNVVTGANAILDDTKGKKQNVINKETDDELLRLEQSKQDNLNFDNTPTEDSTNPVTSGGVYTAEKALSDAIEAILLLIPSAATALNKLVDTNTMNSSISTATATFRGTYNAVSDLGLTYQATHAQIEAALDALGLTADNNDFAFVQIPVSDQSQDIAKTERFKFNGTNWLYEYDLNTSGFTAAQWAAINSTITLALVQKLAALPTNAELLQALGLKQDVLTFDNAPTTDSNNPVKSGGIKNAIDTAVGDEATDRENADTALSGLIGDEKTRAEGVEGGLDTRLGAVEGSVSTIQGVIPSEATSSNKLVDNSSMTTYIGTIIDNIDATFNVHSTDGHIILHVTQVEGVITNVQVTTSDIASAADLTLLAGRVTSAEENITSLTTRMSGAETDIATLTALYNALQQSEPDIIEPTDTWPVANPSGTVIYRVIDRVNTPPEYYSDYMWNGTAFVLMATYNNAVDAVPTAGSNNLVKSGGVFANIGAFDISEYHKSGSTLATYTDLTAALAALPSSYQKGGMSIKFVQSSDNKYVQFRCKTQSFSANPEDWYIDSEDTLVDSPEYIKVKTDSEGRIYEAITVDGKKEEYIPAIFKEKIIAEKSIESPKIKSPLFEGNTAVEGDQTIGGDLNVTGTSTSENVVVNENLETETTITNSEENSEFLKAIIDSNGKVSEGTRPDGTKFIGGNLEVSGNIINNGIQQQINTAVEDAAEEINAGVQSKINGALNKYQYIKTFAGYSSCYMDSLGSYLASIRLKNQLNTPFVDVLLNERDKEGNTAGKTFYYDGYVYVLKYQGETVGSPESEYLYLVKVNVNDSSDLTYVLAFDVNEVITFDDQTSITSIAAHEGGLFIENDTIQVVSLIEYKDGNDVSQYQLVNKTFNTSLVQQGSAKKCTINVDGTSYNFNFSELPSDFAGIRANWNTNSCFNAGISKIDNDYYGCFTFQIGNRSYMLYTSDFDTWNVKFQIPSRYWTYGESAIIKFGGRIYMATRGMLGITYVTYMNSDFSLIDEMSIKAYSTGSMATFFINNGKLYLLCNGSDPSNPRFYYRIIRISPNSLVSSEIVCDTNGVCFGPNTILCTDSDDNIYGCITSSKLILAKFTIPQVTNQECDAVMNTLFNI